MIIIFILAVGAGFYAGLIGFFIAGLVGLGFGVTYFMTAVFAAFSVDAPVGHLRMDPPENDKHDPAYPSYFTGPVLRDHWLAVRTSMRQSWNRVVDADRDDAEPSLVMQVSHLQRRVRGGYLAIFAVLASIGVRAGLVAGVIAAAGFIALTSTVFFASLCVLVLVAVLTTLATRAFERTVLFVRGLSVECPDCHDRVTRPIFRCPSCDVQHHKLLPSRSGVLRRTCRCGSPVPTLLANGKSALVSQCPSCSSQLPSNAQVNPTFHVPVVAGQGAGKSVYMYTAIARLMVLGEPDDRFAFASQTARDEFEAVLDSGALNDPKLVTKTRDQQPKAFTMNLGPPGRARKLLYLYDSAGERIANVERLAESNFLAHTKGVVFIVDPFSLAPVARAAAPATLRDARPSPADAKSISDKLVQSLQEHVRDDRRHRLPVKVAVVITKADALLADPALRHPYSDLAATDRAARDRAARDWLAAYGDRTDLVVSLDNHFAAVSYFVVSYEDSTEVTQHTGPGAPGPVSNDDPAEPLHWLMSPQGRPRWTTTFSPTR